MTTTKRESDPSADAVGAARQDVAARALGETGHDVRKDAAIRHSAHVPRNNLVLPRTPLIGRDHELAVVQQLLLQEHVGLLTLTGPGGIGKTRLAMQVAANVLDHFMDGVYFVSLAPISDPELVGATIAQTLGVREASGRSMLEGLQEYLRANNYCSSWTTLSKSSRLRRW